MKKKLILFTALLAGFASSGVFTSCKDTDEDLRNEVLSLVSGKYNRDSLQADINKLRTELLGLVPTVEIGGNGNWFINGQDTGVPATGPAGQNGTNGTNGTNGVDGHTPVITISEDGYWVIDGVKTTQSARPDKWEIGSDGYWYLNGEKTEFKALGTDGTNGTNGKDGVTPTFKVEGGHLYYSVDNGATWIDLGNVQGADGQNGQDGQVGHTPEISFEIDENGHLIVTIDGVAKDLGNVKGQDGQNGQDGEDGQDGHSPAVSFEIDSNGHLIVTIDGVVSDLGNVVGADGNDGATVTPAISFVIDDNGHLIVTVDGVSTDLGLVKGADGNDGAAGDTVEIVDGYWWINGQNTGVPATGPQGPQGDQGEQGEQGTVTIEIKNGTWWINGVDTGIKAKGAQGEQGPAGPQGPQGPQGPAGADGADGSVITIETVGGVAYWFIDGVNTGYPVQYGCGCDVDRYNAACDAVEYAQGVVDAQGTTWEQIALAGYNIQQVLADIAQLKQDVIKAQNTANDAKKKAEQALNALKAQITGIVLQGTHNPIFGTFNTPVGINSQMLMTYYGECAGYVDFPMDAFDNEGYDYSLVNNMPTMGVTGDLISPDTDNCGFLYLTINPSSTDFSGITPKLVNSLGEESPMVLSATKVSDQKLSFGYTATDTRAAGTGFYECSAYLSAADAAATAPRFDLSAPEVKEALKDIITPSDGIEWAKISKVLYTLANDILDAQAVKVEWTDALGTHAVTSNYGIAATAVKALGFDFDPSGVLGDMVDTAFDKIFDVANRIWNKVVNKIKAKYGDTLTDYSVTHYSVDGNTIHAHVVGPTIDEDVVINISDLDDAVNVAWINEHIDDINSYISKINNYYDKVVNGNSVSNAIERVLDKIADKLKSYINSFNSKLQPCLFIGDQTGTLYASRMASTPSEVDPGTVNFVASTHMLDMLAPAYLKYVACTNAYELDGVTPKSGNAAPFVDAVNSASQGHLNYIHDSETVLLEVSGMQSGVVYEFSYAAVDYTGATRIQHYYVKVK